MFFLDAHHSQQKFTSRSRCNLVPKSPPPGVVGARAHPLWKMMEFVSWDDEIPNTKNDSYLFPIWVYFHMYVYIYIWKNKNMFQTTTFVPHELSWLVAMPIKKRADHSDHPKCGFSNNCNGPDLLAKSQICHPVDLSPPLPISDPRRKRPEQNAGSNRNWKGQLWMSWKCHGNMQNLQQPAILSYVRKMCE